MRLAAAPSPSVPDRITRPVPHRAPATSGVSVRTLGVFGVTAGGEAVTIPNGLPRQALKLTIAHGGHVHVEVVMELLWPDVDLSGGRKGIRNVLSRLASTGVPLLVRDDEVLRIAGDVQVDALQFRTLADRALSDGNRTRVARLARRALALYHGPFLADDRYVDWADDTRRRLQRRRVALLDVLAADARSRGAEVEAVHLMESALEDDPVDERRYFELAEVLVAQGRRGRACALLDQAEDVLARLGIGPDATWSRLRLEVLRGAPALAAGAGAGRALGVTTEGPRAPRHFTHHRQTGPNHRGGSA